MSACRVSESREFGPRRRSASPRSCTPGSPGRAFVVEPQQHDDVLDVGIVLDPTRGRALLAGEDRVIGDPPLLAELRPNSLGKAEVGGMVAVHVAEFTSPDGERELTTSAGSGLDAGPRGDLSGDALAGAGTIGSSRHGGLLGRKSEDGRHRVQVQVSLKSRPMSELMTIG